MKKLPVICLVDSSIYNAHEKLQATNIALEVLYKLLNNDDYLKESCEIYFYTFSKNLIFKSIINSKSNLRDFQISENELFGLNFLGNALYNLEKSISFGKEFYRPNLFIFSSNNAVDVFTFESFSKTISNISKFSNIVIYSMDNLTIKSKYKYMTLTDNILNVEYLTESVFNMCLKFEE
ncbi:hypothetical protein [Acinetobacter sp. YH01021]|uniref:hypothetical protein n=1 Tax=Acinetobacter sp. YH01021 TaxID=2601035 RepID=UPI0015D2AA86|nr:hypothetical protein [Acinetobacter sp. YH01021]